MEEVEKAFDPKYVLNGLGNMITGEEIFLNIQQCHLNSLSIKRRLLFLDNVNSANQFFKYSEQILDKLKKIDLEVDDKKNVSQNKDMIIHKLYKFWGDNSKELNKNSLIFISEINQSLFKENK